jgi:hypothetical protein
VNDSGVSNPASKAIIVTGASEEASWSAARSSLKRSLAQHSMKDAVEVEGRQICDQREFREVQRLIEVTGHTLDRCPNSLLVEVPCALFHRRSLTKPRLGNLTVFDILCGGRGSEGGAAGIA